MSKTKNTRKSIRDWKVVSVDYSYNDEFKIQDYIEKQLLTLAKDRLI